MVQLSQTPKAELPNERNYLKCMEVKMFFWKSATLSDHVWQQPEVALHSSTFLLLGIKQPWRYYDAHKQLNDG